MSAGDAAVTNSEAAARRGVEPSGIKPTRLSPARLGIYAFLAISAAFFLFPLYVMVVTSLKAMPEIRLGYLFDLPHKITFQPWIDAGCTPAPAATAMASARASSTR